MTTLLLVSLAGFAAQLVDGSMGMAFGVTATSVLLLLAFNPAAASAIIHLAEVFTTAASGISHIRFGNVHWPALLKIAIPGAVGGFVGAVLLSNIDFSAARPWTSGILLVLGALIIVRFLRRTQREAHGRTPKKWLIPLGFTGGFVDATGGGGWGPIVTTSLTLSRSLEPRKAIGTTNAAEFIVALSASIGFLVSLGSEGIDWGAVFALIIGGFFAAPIAAWLITKVHQRVLGTLVGAIIVLLNVRQLLISFEVSTGVFWSIIGVALVGAVVAIRSADVLRRSEPVEKPTSVRS